MTEILKIRDWLKNERERNNSSSNRMSREELENKLEEVIYLKRESAKKGYYYHACYLRELETKTKVEIAELKQNERDIKS